MEETGMRRTFQIWLLLFLLAAFVLTFGISFAVQTTQSTRSTEKTLRQALDTARETLADNQEDLREIRELNDRAALAKARALAQIARQEALWEDAAKLQDLLEALDVDEINIIDDSGVIVATTYPDYLGYHMDAAQQSGEFLALLEGKLTEYVQEPRAVGYDGVREMQYAAALLPGGGGFAQVGFVPQRLYDAMEVADLSGLVRSLRIGYEGGMLLLKDDVVVSACREELVGLSVADLRLNETALEGYLFRCRLGGVRYTCLAQSQGDYIIMGIMPTSEAFVSRNSTVIFLLGCFIVLFIVVFLLVSVMVQQVVIGGIRNVNKTLQQITEGDLDRRVNERSSPEFGELSDGINATVASLKQYMQEAEDRYKADLQLATDIQRSVLPEGEQSRPGCEVCAAMYPALEVGGDFYDVFPLPGDRLALIIADVSGKGIPSAMMMMRSKATIRNLIEAGLSPAEVFQAANGKLCEGNDAEMFLTAWLGILDLHSGELRCVSAGHEYPTIRRSGGAYELFKDPRGFVLAAMEDMEYPEYTLQLQPGDSLFVYTDGVPEATDQSETLYGNERMLAALSRNASSDPGETLRRMKSDIDLFVRDAPQFDDITMLALRYTGL